MGCLFLCTTYSMNKYNYIFLEVLKIFARDRYRIDMKKYKVPLISILTVIGVCILATFICIALDVKVVMASDGGSVKIGLNANNIQNMYDNTKITFYDTDTLDEYTYKELGIQSEFSDKQLDYLGNNFIIDANLIQPAYNTSELMKHLKEMNESRQPYVYANIEKSNSEFIVTEETEGNMLDTDKLEAVIIEELDGTDKDYDLTNYYIERDNTKPTYNELLGKVDGFNNTCIEYTNGYKISLKDYIDYYSVKDNTIQLSENTAEELKTTIDKTIEKELSEYDTIGNKIEFTTTDGDTLNIGGGTWGNIFSSDDETEYILDKFDKLESENSRTPIYSQEMNTEIGDTYIEISIEKQHVWHYVNGELCCESDCVTGKLDGSHETPTGVYYILERQNGRTLRPKGSTSGTWVNKWMRITWDGVGLHDAYWRGAFGGTIYKHNGSHGCINLPKTYAYNLYNEISLGDCVVIY